MHPGKISLVTVVAGFLGSLLLGGGILGFDRAHAPPYRFEWARSISGPLEGESGQDLVVAADGSFYVVGSHGGLDLDRDGIVDVPAMSCGGPCPRSSMDPLLLKFSPDGYLVWLRSPDGPQTDWGERIALDGMGGVYIAGLFRETLTFESGRHIESNGEADGFLARYDAEGNSLWAVAIGGPDADGVTGVAVDREGNVYVTATVRGAVDVDGDGMADLVTTGEVNPLIASFTADGDLRWARTVQTPTRSFGGSIALGSGGEIFVGGRYSNGTIDFDGDGRPDLPAASEGPEPFLARFDSAGTFSWARNLWAGRFTVTENGDLIVLGALRGPLDLDGDGAPDADTAGGGPRGYLARLTSEGALIWVRTFAAISTMHVATDGARLVVSGFYRGTLDLDGDGTPEGAADPDGESEGLVAIFSVEGDLEQVFTVVGPGSDQIRAAGFSPDGTKLYATGFVRLTADFDGDGVVEGGVRCDARGDLIVAGYDVTPRRR